MNLLFGFLALVLSFQASASEGTMIYIVPTPEAPELEPYTEYPSKFDFTVGADGISRLHYILPATISGNEIEMRFEGMVDYNNPQAPFQLKGPNGEATCAPLDKDPSQAMCNVVHHNVGINLLAVMDALSKETSMSEDQMMGHLAVSAFLLDKGGDMVGTFIYSLNQF